METTSIPPILPYTAVLVKLLKGPVEYRDKGAWEQLLHYQQEVTRFCQQIGLVLILEKDDGYAYLEQLKGDEGEAVVNWMRRTPLTYDESVLLVLLREMMADFEVGEVTSRELIKKRREIKEYAEDFFKENASRTRFVKELDRLIDRVEDLGFLEKMEDADLLDEQSFRIKKWIKSRIDNEELSQFKNRLREYTTNRV